MCDGDSDGTKIRVKWICEIRFKKRFIFVPSCSHFSTQYKLAHHHNHPFCFFMLLMYFRKLLDPSYFLAPQQSHPINITSLFLLKHFAWIDTSELQFTCLVISCGDMDNDWLGAFRLTSRKCVLQLPIILNMPCKQRTYERKASFSLYMWSLWLWLWFLRWYIISRHIIFHMNTAITAILLRFCEEI